MKDKEQKISQLKTSNKNIDIDLENIKNDVLIFSSEDEKLKFLGEIFSNQSSRTILTLLIEKEMTVMQISDETSLSPNLIIHHLKKMLQSDMVIVSKETMNKRGHSMKFYRAKSSIMIFSKNSLERAQKSKSLFKAIKKITRFAGVGLAGILTWMITNSGTSLETASKYPRPTLPPYMTPIEPHVQSGELVFSIVMTASVVVMGLVINFIISRRNRQKNTA